MRFTPSLKGIADIESNLFYCLFLGWHLDCFVQSQSTRSLLSKNLQKEVRQ